MVQMADDADKMLQVFAGPCARGLSMSGVPMMPCLLHPCRIRVSRSRSSGEALAAQVRAIAVISESPRRVARWREYRGDNGT